MTEKELHKIVGEQVSKETNQYFKNLFNADQFNFIVLDEKESLDSKTTLEAATLLTIEGGHRLVRNNDFGYQDQPTIVFTNRVLPLIETQNTTIHERTNMSQVDKIIKACKSNSYNKNPVIFSICNFSPREAQEISLALKRPLICSNKIKIMQGSDSSGTYSMATFDGSNMIYINAHKRVNMQLPSVLRIGPTIKKQQECERLSKLNKYKDLQTNMLSLGMQYGGLHAQTMTGT